MAEIWVDENTLIETDSKDNVRMTKKVDVEDIQKVCFQERINSLFDKPMGQSKMMKVGTIPIDVLLAMGERGVEMLNDSSKILRFFEEHPEFKSTNKRVF